MGLRNQYPPLREKTWDSMPIGYEYVPSWDCYVSDKQSNWQQTLQRRACNRVS